jgi:hypothetical protein
MCFAHSGTASDAVHVQAGIGAAAATTSAELAESGGLSTVDVAGSGTPDAVAAHVANGRPVGRPGIITYDGAPTHSVSIMEFADEKVAHETQYFADPFSAPEWRTALAEPMPEDGGPWNIS